MKKLIVSILLLVCFSTAFAQDRPGNNLGKSLSTMKKEFPELRFLRAEEKGDFYEDGYPKDGIAMFFYLKNGFVIEECMICEGTDGFPKMWHDSLCKSFTSNYPKAMVKNTYNSKVYDFGDFKVSLIFYAEDGKKTALIIYESTKISFKS